MIPAWADPYARLDPPLPSLDEFETLPLFWADDDGEYWVLADGIEFVEAWRALEASLGMPVSPVRRTAGQVNVSDCEMGHHCEMVDPNDYDDGESACDAHPGCPKSPCPAPRPELTWAFQDADDDEMADRWRGPKDPDEPEVIPVAPGQVEAGL